MRLLLVEDEAALARHLRRGLTEEGYATDVAADCRQAQALLEETDYDLVVLDLMLPDCPGLDLLRLWRRQGVEASVLILTARDGVEDKVQGLDGGADDYLTKPFDFEELLARIRSLLRRTTAPPMDVLEVEDLKLDRTGHCASRDGVPLELTPKEFALLEYFMLHRGAVLDRTRIAEHVWDHGYEARTNTIDVIVSRLRRKLEEGRRGRLIYTVTGVGYVLRGSEGAEA